MFYLVLQDGGRYRAGEVLDLGDPEMATRIARVCGGLRVLSAEEAAELTAARQGLEHESAKEAKDAKGAAPETGSAVVEAAAPVVEEKAAPVVEEEAAPVEVREVMRPRKFRSER